MRDQWTRGVRLALASDRFGEFGERSGDPQRRPGVNGEFVVAAALILDEGMAGDHHLRALISLKPSHWSRPALELTVIGLYWIVRVLLDVVPRRGYQVLLAVIGLSRRADVVEVIGVSLVAKAAGGGHRQIAVLVGRPASTVRGWLRRFAGRAESVRAAFTALAVDVDPGTAPPAAAETGFADAVAAVLAATVAVLSRWPQLRLTVSPWLLASAVSHGGLLASASGVELINTNRLWVGLWRSATLTRRSP